MTVQTSSVDAAITYLVAAAKGAFPNALVLDGPMVVVDQDTYQDMVAVGWDGDPEGEMVAAESDQDFAALNRGVTRDEHFSIVCCVKHWDGDNDAAKARGAARDLLAGFERLMRGYPPNGTGDVTLGGAVTWAGLSGGFQWIYEADGDGTACRIAFRVTCFTRLTGS